MQPHSLVELGHVATAHGLAGEVLFRPHNRGSELPAGGMTVVLAGPRGQERTVRVVQARAVAKGRLLAFDGVGDRTAAEALRGWTLSVARSDLPPLGEGEFYYEDVVGATVRGPDGTELGRVAEILRTSTDVLVVRGPGRELLVPVVEGFVEAVGPDGVRLGPEALRDGDEVAGRES
jgi:16S rRNA processing protein RimM